MVHLKKIEILEVINEYLTSPHKAVRCTLKLHKQGIVSETGGGKADEMKKLNWDLKKIQGILKRASMENKNFEECSREEVEFCE